MKHSKKTKKAKKNYKDSVFRMLFKEKKELLSLFNAINETDYSNPDDLVINTLENAIYMSMKNDISCVLDMQMQLYEHQSSVNPNMPLRYLMYVGDLYEKMITKKDIYGRKKILLPTPKFIVLYNGTEQQPERKKLRLSDSYMTETGEINLELIVLQLNINKDLNFKIKEQCQTLYEYTQYVELVRKYQQTESLEEAVEHAIDKCIEENILREFLEQNRREVTKLSIYEYNKELHEKSLLNEGIETGEQRKLKEIVYRMLDKNSTLETICDITGEPQSKIHELQKSYKQMLREKDLS